MPINFDAIPKDKPGFTSVAPGRYLAVIEGSEMKISTKTGDPYLNVKLKLEKGGFVFDAFMDSDNDFIRWKLGRFLSAINIQLEGSFELKDLCKLIKKGTKLEVQVAPNDKGYATIDFSNKSEGYYAVTTESSKPPKTKAEPEMDADVAEALDDVDADTDGDF